MSTSKYLNSMEKDKERTAVIFRRERQFGRPIVALFPYISYKPEHRARREYKVLAYTHFGQHHEVDYNVQMAFSTPVFPEEYEPLKRELENFFGYNLRIIQRACRKKMYQL